MEESQKPVINDNYSLQFNNMIFALLMANGLIWLYAINNANENIERICSYLFFVFGYTLFIISFTNNKINFLKKFVFIMFFLILWMINSATYDVLILILSFMLSLSAWDSAKSILKTDRIINFITFILFVQGLFLVSLYFTPKAYQTVVEGQLYSKDLTLGFSNPNMTGMIIVSTVMELLLCFLNLKNKIIKFSILLLSAYLVYLLVLTGSRTCLLGFIFFLLFSFYNRKGKTEIYENKLILFIIIALPFLFVFVYLYMFKNGYEVGVEFLGKSLFSGRQRVYQYKLNSWSNHFFGNLGLFKFDNAHNGFLSILINTGFIGFALYLLHIFSNFFNLQRTKGNSLISRMAFIALITIFIMSSAESSFLTGGKFYYTNFLLFCWLANID